MTATLTVEDMTTSGTTNEGDTLFEGEVLGTKPTMLYSFNASTAVAVYGHSGNTINSANIGAVMLHAGSVTAIRTVYDQTVSGTAQFSAQINGVTVFTDAGSTGTGSFDIRAVQARGVDTFSAGDRISAFIDPNGATINEITVDLEVFIDS